MIVMKKVLSLIILVFMFSIPNFCDAKMVTANSQRWVQASISSNLDMIARVDNQTIVFSKDYGTIHFWYAMIKPKNEVELLTRARYEVGDGTLQSLNTRLYREGRLISSSDTPKEIVVNKPNTMANEICLEVLALVVCGAGTFF